MELSKDRATILYIPVEPHEAVPEVSKGKVHITQNKHVPIEWFVTTASQSRIWLKLLSDDSNKVCLLCRSTQLHATTSCRSQFATTCGSSYVLQSSTPVLLCTTPYYKVLIQYYSVLQSTTPVLLCTWSVLLQYYSVLQSITPVLQSTTPVLLCTTKYYSSTTLMIDPRHLWNFIYNARNNRGASTKSPTAAPATENDSHDWSASHMKR